MQDSSAVPHELECTCGRLWRIYRLRTPFAGSLRCRCYEQLIDDPEGHFGAELVLPREHFAGLRRLAYRLIMPLYPLTVGTRVQLAEWLPVDSIVHWRMANHAVKSRVECSVISTMGRIHYRRWQEFWKAAVQMWKLGAHPTRPIR